MNREDIVKMAREAGLSRVQADLLELGKDVSFDIEMLDAFATLVAAAEREACAKIAESYEPRCDTCPSGVSNAIRARGTK